MAALTKIGIKILIDNVLLSTTNTKLSPLYNGQFGVDWQGHRIEVVVGYIGDGLAPVCTGSAAIAIDDLATITICS